MDENKSKMNEEMQGEVKEEQLDIKEVEVKNDKWNKFTEIKSKIKMKSVIAFSSVFVVGVLIGVGGSDNSQIVNDYESQIESLNAEIKESNELVLTLENTRIMQIDEMNELRAKVKEAEPWFEMQEKEREELVAKENAEQEAKAKAEQEEKDKKEKQGYNTGITYSQIARNPDDYKGSKVTFKGKVIQVLEGDGEVQVRLAVNGSYDNVIYGVYSSDIVKSRVLENDTITIMGTSCGLLTYKSTMGSDITIPSILVEKIESK
ncbi:hypothetical protein [Clostridium sp.]|uniref:hypothetical protein n=1 Tax=Clostridium sp. TaxID=1506 RepID=UPI003F2A7597